MRMNEKDNPKNEEPEWLNPSKDRKVPYTDEQIELFVSEFIENNSDVQAWIDLVQDVGDAQARQILKERFLAQDEHSLVNWTPFGPPN
jgi:hypothetical protein